MLAFENIKEDRWSINRAPGDLLAVDVYVNVEVKGDSTR